MPEPKTREEWMHMADANAQLAQDYMMQIERAVSDIRDLQDGLATAHREQAHCRRQAEWRARKVGNERTRLGGDRCGKEKQ